MYGIDLYAGDKGIDLLKGDYQFAIVKATEGKTFVDPMFKDFTVQLSGLGKLLGAYHFARPDNRKDVDDAVLEIDHFIKTVEEAGILEKAILCIDWETEPLDRLDMLEAMCKRVLQTTGIKPFIYASLSFFKQYEKVEWISDFPTWVAYWTKIGTLKVGTIHGNVFLNNNYTIWQYTDKGKYPDHNGYIDLNYTYLSAAEWKKYTRQSMMATENLTEDVKWAIQNGLYIGYPDGTYRPNEFVTRSQLATVLKRFYEMQEKKFEMFEKAIVEKAVNTEKKLEGLSKLLDEKEGNN